MGNPRSMELQEDQLPEDFQEMLHEAIAASHLDDKNDLPLFLTDDFRIYCMKVLPCHKRFCHDWTICPYAHTGEKAKRRDPRSAVYTGIACVDMKKDGTCIRGDNCPYAHNVFEYWLHPTRYRTQLCNDGPKCRRRICFFAHTLDQLRVPNSKPYVSPEVLAAATAAAAAGHCGEMGGVPPAVAAGGQRWRTQSAMPAIQHAPPPPGPPPGHPGLYATASVGMPPMGLDASSDLTTRLAALQATSGSNNGNNQAILSLVNQLLSHVETDKPTSLHRSQSERPPVRMGHQFGGSTQHGGMLMSPGDGYGERGLVSQHTALPSREGLLSQMRMHLNTAGESGGSHHGSNLAASGLWMDALNASLPSPDLPPVHPPVHQEHQEHQLSPHGGGVDEYTNNNNNNNSSHMSLSSLMQQQPSSAQQQMLSPTLSARIPPPPPLPNPFATADGPYDLDKLQQHIKSLQLANSFTESSTNPSTTMNSMLDSIAASSFSGSGVPIPSRLTMDVLNGHTGQTMGGKHPMMPEAVSEASTSYRSQFYRTNSNCSSRMYSRVNSHDTYTIGSLKDGPGFSRIMSIEEQAPFDLAELEREEALRSILASAPPTDATARDALRTSPGNSQHRGAAMLQAKLAAVQEGSWQTENEQSP